MINKYLQSYHQNFCVFNKTVNPEYKIYLKYNQRPPSYLNETQFLRCYKEKI